MALRLVADSLDDIPAGLRDSAKKDETGKHVVDKFADGWAIEDVAGLKESVSTLRHAVDAHRSALKPFGWRWSDDRREWAEKGLAPSDVDKAREALEKLEAGQLRGSKEIDDYKLSVEKKMADQTAALESKLKARTDALRERMIRGELAPVIAQLGGADSMDAILTLAERHIRIDETENGTLKHSIVDRDGKPRVTKKGGSADPLGLDELIAEMREAPSTRGLFKASGAGGSGGSSQAGGSGRSAGQLDTSKMSPAELIELGNQRGM